MFGTILVIVSLAYIPWGMVKNAKEGEKSNDTDLPAKKKSPTKFKFSPIASKNKVACNSVFEYSSRLENYVFMHAKRPGKNANAFTNYHEKEFDEDPVHWSKYLGFHFHTRRRVLNGSNDYLRGADGKPWPWPIFVKQLGDGESVDAAGCFFANGMTRFSIEQDKDHPQLPFVYTKDLTPESKRPVNAYLMDEDCFMMLKKIYGAEYSKEELANDETIMATFFGDKETGRALLIDMVDEEWFSIVEN